MDTLEDNTLLIGDNTSEGIKNRIQRVNENILKENRINIFPNPANDYVKFKLLSKTNISFIEIINIQGILVNQQKIVNNQNTIDVSDLSVGMYIIKINTDNGYIMKKFI